MIDSYLLPIPESTNVVVYKGDHKNWNYLLSGHPLIKYRLPPLGECSRNPSVSVYQLALLWEAVSGYSDFFFFEDSFQVFAHFMSGLPSPRPKPTELSAVSDPKWHDPPGPPSLCTQSCPQGTFFISLDVKNPQRETYCWCGRGETKKQQKPYKAWKLTSSKMFGAVEEIPGPVYASDGEDLDSDWSLNM